MKHTTVSLAERPDLWEQVWAFGGASSWPEFMLHDPVSGLYYNHVEERFAEWVIALVDADDQVVGAGFSVPYEWDGDEETLSGNGWDSVILRGTRPALHAPLPTASAVEIRVPPALRGRGYSGLVLDGMRRNAAEHGVAVLLAPVRPSEKHKEPHTPIGDYAQRRRPDGLPADAWLRAHERTGGRIIRVAPCSMTIPGSLAQWRAWTGLPFDRSGPTDVPGALVPVHVDIDQDHAVYVEPNVWVLHQITKA